MTKNYISPKLIILCMVFCLSSVYLILTNGLLPLNGKIDVQDLISCIIVPIIQVVSFRLLITRHDKITEKFGAVLTAALCIMVGLKFAYMSLAFSSSSWFGITDVASAILICAAVHLAYAAVLFAVSIPFYHLFQRLTSKK